MLYTQERPITSGLFYLSLLYQLLVYSVTMVFSSFCIHKHKNCDIVPKFLSECQVMRYCTIKLGILVPFIILVALNRNMVHSSVILGYWYLGLVQRLLPKLLVQYI